MSDAPFSDAQQMLLSAKEVYTVGERPLPKRSGFLRSVVQMVAGATLTLVAMNNIPLIPDVGVGLKSFLGSVTNTISHDPGVPAPKPFVSKSTSSSYPLGWIERDQSQTQPTSFDQAIEADDRIDFNEAFAEMLKAQNMTAKDATVVVTHYQIANTISVLGGEEPTLRETETQRQRESYQWVEQAYQLLAYSDPSHPEHDKWTELMETAPQDPQVELNLRLYREYKNKDPWSAVEFRLQQDLTSDIPELSQTHSLKHVDTQAKSLTLAQARHRLQESVERSGLASLRLSHPISQTPQSLVRLAHMLDSANAELQHITGLTGGVLGVNKRVILDLDAFTTTATTYYTNSDSYIHIKSYWDKLPHEWFHAMDYAMQESYAPLSFLKPARQEALSRANNPSYRDLGGLGDKFGLAAAQQALWQSFEHPDLSADDRRKLALHVAEHNQEHLINNPDNFYDRANMMAVKDVPENGSPWLYWRKQNATRAGRQSMLQFVFGDHMSRYLRSETEALAFSFATYAQLVLDQENSQGRIVHLHEREDEGQFVGFEVFGPEAQAQAGAWKTFFQATRPWWQHDQHARGLVGARTDVQPLSFEQLHQKRRPQAGRNDANSFSSKPST